ncbi:MAG: hypothetical protein CSYNP_04252 [Syntrophus sp. SKADARSKE-3]|nr:hypothetical protein [Syntrophus sp. SKADARSKE-3]
MICCGGCKAKAGVDLPRWMPELIIASSEPNLYLKPLYFETDLSCPPETVYIDVPVKPPIFA